MPACLRACVLILKRLIARTAGAFRARLVYESHRRHRRLPPQDPCIVSPPQRIFATMRAAKEALQTRADDDDDDDDDDPRCLSYPRWALTQSWVARASALSLVTSPPFFHASLACGTELVSSRAGACPRSQSRAAAGSSTRMGRFAQRRSLECLGRLRLAAGLDSRRVRLCESDGDGCAKVCCGN